MEHLAIMKKEWHLTEKILTGEKKIESRWYMSKYSPWNKIEKGELVYFKDSGEPVTIRTETKKVLQFSDLTPAKVMKILNKYGKIDGINIKDIKKFYERFKDKNYCILIFLKNPRKIKSFKINKEGFGLMSAWLTVDNVNKLRKK